MTTDTVKNAILTIESVVNFLFFETLTTEKSATGQTTSLISGQEINLIKVHSVFPNST